MSVAGSPDYFERHPPPKTPQDLTSHHCINQRMVTSGGLYVWDFERRGRKVNVRVDGPLIFNTTQPQVDAALAGLGIALLPEDELMQHIQAGKLVRVLQDWCPKFAGYHLYYPSRRQPSPAFALVVQALRISSPKGD
jgi:DNA-binding transcriptional LysR family regulator